MGQYRAEVTGKGEMNWSTNAMRYDTIEEATDWLKGLAGRWFGFDASRVVEDTVPLDEPFDPTDERIVHNFKK